MLLGVVGWISVSVVEAQSFFFVVLIKENRILTMIRYHVKPNINILLTRNLPFGSGVRQWSRPLITLFEQFEREVNWFRFDFAHSHARYHLDRGVCNWRPKVKGVEELRTQMDRGGRKTSELGYFHGRHMCIIPKTLFTYHSSKTCSHIVQENSLFLSGFFSWIFTIHRTAEEGWGYFFNCSPPLSSASKLRYWLVHCRKERTAAYSWQLV